MGVGSRDLRLDGSRHWASICAPSPWPSHSSALGMKVLGPQHVRTVAVLSQAQARQRGLCCLQSLARSEDGGALRELLL